MTDKVLLINGLKPDCRQVLTIALAIVLSVFMTNNTLASEQRSEQNPAPEQAEKNAWFSWWRDDSPQLATVADPFIDMRTGPGRGYPIFYVAERGETVELIKQRTTWVKVRNHKGKEGWVHVDQMARTLDTDGSRLAFKQYDRENFSNREWEGGFLLGDFGGSDAITAYGSYHMTRNLSLEASVSETFGEFSNSTAASLTVVHQPFPNWRYSPFFSLGGGKRKTDPHSSIVATEDRSDNTLEVGAGVRVYLFRHFLLRVQYKRHTVLTNRDDDEEIDEWTIGFSTFF